MKKPTGSNLFPIIENDTDEPIKQDDLPPWAVRGCSIVYAPRGQAGEYAKLATSPYRGCGHKCAYCYVPRVTRQPRAEFDLGAVERDNYLGKLKNDLAKYQAAGITEQVMLSFTTDPYHPGDTSLTAKTLDMIQDHGLGICTLTKGGTRALRDIGKFRPDRDSFASTLTSLDDEFSKKWEAGAALPGDRLEALKTFHDAGIFTWVSLEPTLDLDTSLEIIEKTSNFVDLYKVGRANYLEMTKTTDWEVYTHQAIGLLTDLGKLHYIKEDLQKFLPPNYHNPKYINQHW